MGGDTLQLSLNTINNTLIVEFIGELDHHSSEAAKQMIDEWYYGKQIKNIIFNLSKLEFMDSSGVGLIVARYKICCENGGKALLVNNSPQIERILQMTGILKIMDEYSSISDAVDNIIKE